MVIGVIFEFNLHDRLYGFFAISRLKVRIVLELLNTECFAQG